MQDYRLLSPDGRERQIVTSLFTSDMKPISNRQDDMQRALSLSLYACQMHQARRLHNDLAAIDRMRFLKRSAAEGMGRVNRQPPPSGPACPMGGLRPLHPRFFDGVKRDAGWMRFRYCFRKKNV